MSLMMASYSYVSDVTPNSTRTSRITILDLMYFISSPLGLYLSAILYKSIGYLGVFLVSGLVFLTLIVYVVCFVTETRGPFSSCYMMTAENNSMFNVNNVKDTLKTYTRKQQHRSRLLTLMFTVCLLIVPFG